MVAERVPASVDVTEEGDTLILSLRGELDIAAARAIEPVVMAGLTSASTVTVDLAKVTFCDSSGVAMFIAVAQKAEAEGTVLSLRNTPRNVRRVFEIANLDHEIDVRD
jgi:anti-sigma B factor antagonist